MKVFHASETIKGGVATVQKQLAQAQILSTAVTQVTCLVPEDQVSEIDEIDAGHLLTFRRTGRDVGSFWRFLTAFCGYVWRENPDIVHLHSTFAGVLGRLALVALRPLRKPKVVYCPHAFAFLMDNSPTKRKLYVWVEKLLLPMTDKIICVSDYEKTSAVQLTLSAEKMVVVHNGVPDRGHPPEALRAHDELNLLFVGRLDFQKGYDIIIDAMRQLQGNPIHLTIVGDSVNGQQEKIALPNITYTGWLRSQELEKYFLAADALVIPSRWEGFAMVPLEAMSYGLAIVASDSTSLPEVVIDGKTGRLFKNGNANDLKDKILTLQHAEFREMGSAGYKLYKSSFTSELMISKTFQVYDELWKKC
ncbi:Putative glycosyltransferase [Sodalis praecaptivus]|uniref:Putative glycosyltransferase n=1 Tax=Sodalis praecaptivus TaxID=1239307 RepID=W0HRS8_9GAMM|nr:glycosyltransferase [Sodalis praecaptivus]AHF76516.1 Putative glycosyltransferase [Sodalis praecaptivus]